MSKVFRHTKDLSVDGPTLINEAIRRAGGIAILANIVGYTVAAIRVMRNNDMMSKKFKKIIREFLEGHP